MNTVAIKKEDKNKWERRAPLVPHHVEKLLNLGIATVVEDQPNRAFSNEEYQNAGAIIVQNIAEYPVILGVKEIPEDRIHPHKTYMFFSHTIKGQFYNMKMLRELVRQKCTLIDFECIKDEHKRRLVFFGRFAGIAGMIDSLSILGRQLDLKLIQNPFSQIKLALKYEDVKQAKAEIKRLSKQVETGLDYSVKPVVIGIAGYGQVSHGAQEILDLLPVKEITPNELLEKDEWKKYPIVKVVFAEKDMFEPIKNGKKFNLEEYFNSPEKYRSVFEQYLPYLTILVNGIYWEEKYPRLVTKKYLKSVIPETNRKLLQICDVSCDINGSIECTAQVTESDNPAFIYNPKTDEITDGIDGDGLVVLAVDNLPAELPRDASEAFSSAMWPYIPEIANLNKNLNFTDAQLSPEIKNAVIVYNGELTPQFKYLSKYL